MGRYALPIAFLVVPFALLSGGIVHKGHYHAFLLSALFVLPFIEGTGKRVSPYLKGFYFHVMCLTTLAAVAYMVGFIHQRLFNMAFMGMFYFLGAGILFQAALNSPLSRRSWSNVICVAAIFQICLAALQSLGLGPVQWFLSKFARVDPGSMVLVGTLGNKGFLVMYLALSMPFFFRRPWCWFILPMIALMALSNTTTATIAAIVGAGVWGLPLASEKFPKFNRKWAYTAVVMALVVLGGVYIAFFDNDLSKSLNRLPRGDFLVDGRALKWGIALEQVSSNWPSMIFGLGPGVGWGGKGTLHNEWLTAWHLFGLIGLGLIMGFALNISRENREAFAAFIIACVCGIGSLPMHLAPSAFLIIIVAGLCEREKFSHG